MKHYVILLAAAAVLTMCPACKQKKASDDIITTKYEPQPLQAPIAMIAQNQEVPVTWMGSEYNVKIDRQASDSLPMVKDETGQEFKDNKITLTIVKNGGGVFYTRTFTKASFNSYLTQKFRENAILEGMVFHKVDGDELEFAVSVALPESDDEFIPLELSINRFGNIDIDIDTDLDTYGGEKDDDRYDD